ncbi:MAG: uroporphyrinogen decarboxylase family protein, partial [Victivallales bacterium]|nr:uroporphyrinogen decarboxylase family protein [Victivallales bacterium]
EIENYDWPTLEEIIFPEIPPGFDLVTWKRDKVILSCDFICPFGVPWALRGMEQFMMDIYLNPVLVEAIVNKVEEFTLSCLEAVLIRYPGLLDLVGCGDDYGTQNGLLIGPDMIAKFFMPSLKRHYDLGRKYEVGAYHHCCGAIFEIIPQMIAAGMQILNPIQTMAKGMEPHRLKQEFGRDLCFHGGIDTQHLMAFGLQDDVRRKVREMAQTLGPEGYILAPSHVLQPDVPPENIIALYEEAGKIFR